MTKQQDSKIVDSNPSSSNGLLKYDVVRKWIKAYPSETIKTHYLKGLNDILEINNLTPDQLVTLDDKEIQNALTKTTTTLLQAEKRAQAQMVPIILHAFLKTNHNNVPYSVSSIFPSSCKCSI
jgi:hypothetical protein